MIDITTIKTAFPVNMQNDLLAILREYLQYKILQYIFQTKESKKICFIWGTALRIWYNNQRFSEDLDFDNFWLTEEEFENITNYVKKNLELEWLEVELKHIYKWAFHCHIKIPKILFENDMASMPTQKIVIKIDTVSQNFNYTPFNKIISLLDVTTSINIIDTNLLLSQKILTAFDRKRTKGRDFFDILFILKQTKKPNYDFLKQKLNIDNPKDLKQYILDKISELKLDFKFLQKDVQNFLFNPHDQSVLYFPDLIKDIEFEG